MKGGTRVGADATALLHRLRHLRTAFYGDDFFEFYWSRARAGRGCAGACSTTCPLAEVPSRALYSVNLALDEVVTNAILYGFDEPAGQEMQVHLQIADSELKGELIDQGRQFNPLEYPMPRLDVPLQEREVGGLGLHLVRSLMDRLDYRRDGAKNVLTLIKRIR